MYMIWVDMDGVLADLASLTLEIHKDLTGESVEIDELKTYDSIIEKAPYGVLAWNSESGCGHEHSIWTELEPLPGAKELVEYLGTDCDGWGILTVPHPGSRTCYYDKRDWLHNKLGVPQDKLVTAHNKGFVAGYGDLLIDDCEAHLRDAFMAGADVVCIARPWNEGWSGTRISLEELPEWLSEWEAEYILESPEPSVTL